MSGRLKGCQCGRRTESEPVVPLQKSSFSFRKHILSKNNTTPILGCGGGGCFFLNAENMTTSAFQATAPVLPCAKSIL